MTALFPASNRKIIDPDVNGAPAGSRGDGASRHVFSGGNLGNEASFLAGADPAVSPMLF